MTLIQARSLVVTKLGEKANRAAEGEDHGVVAVRPRGGDWVVAEAAGHGLDRDKRPVLLPPSHRWGPTAVVDYSSCLPMN